VADTAQTQGISTTTDNPMQSMGVDGNLERLGFLMLISRIAQAP
jgi:hypothetical protein